MLCLPPFLAFRKQNFPATRPGGLLTPAAQTSHMPHFPVPQPWKFYFVSFLGLFWPSQSRCEGQVTSQKFPSIHPSALNKSPPPSSHPCPTPSPDMWPLHSVLGLGLEPGSGGHTGIRTERQLGTPVYCLKPHPVSPGVLLGRVFTISRALGLS